MIADTPEPPYYAVIFTTRRTAATDDPAYHALAERMVELAQGQPGFLGFESAAEGTAGITVSYWSSRKAIGQWKEHAEHRLAQARGRAEFYEHYAVRIALVERDYRRAARS